MPQPGLQQPTSLQQQQHQLSQQQDFDPVHRFKMLIPQLKESLQVIVPRRKCPNHLVTIDKVHSKYCNVTPLVSQLN